MNTRSSENAIANVIAWLDNPVQIPKASTINMANDVAELLATYRYYRQRAETLTEVLTKAAARSLDITAVGEQSNSNLSEPRKV